jgi:phage protein U
MGLVFSMVWAGGYFSRTGNFQVVARKCNGLEGEEQSALLQGGIPRKQAFTLEFVRYGDDL